MTPAAKVEFGDFQTPLALAEEICALLVTRGEAPTTIVEPTVGVGAFLLGAAAAFPEAQLYGWDINPEHLVVAERALEACRVSDRAHLLQQDFFTADWDALLDSLPGRLLLLGNPPWVTNAGVSVLSGGNVPTKENFMGLRGIAARTGKANFDISEWMLIRLLEALGSRTATLAILCKSATARKVLRYAWQKRLPVTKAALFRIDAAEHFDVSVDACLLYASTGTVGPQQATVYSALTAPNKLATLGMAGKELVADLDGYRALQHLEGTSPVQWRSGVKHDCAAVMELMRESDGSCTSRTGDRCNLEDDYVFPFLKCSDLANGRLEPKRCVIVTQRSVGDDTAVIADHAPRTWSYLQSHAAAFAARKSSIYRGRPPFSLFGIGPYAFSPWKVGVSGLHSSARFQVVGPVNGKPVFFDDASYYLAFERAEEAQLVAKILNSPPARHFLDALVFPHAKRPLTVELLQRLSLAAIAEDAGLTEQWRHLRLETYARSEDLLQSEFVMEDPVGEDQKHMPGLRAEQLEPAPKERRSGSKYPRTLPKTTIALTKPAFRSAPRARGARKTDAPRDASL